jgi:tRNA A-37 threonylcarbamoyl transferase component Bud32
MAILRFTPSPDEELSPEELSAYLTSMMPEIPGYRVMRRIGKGGMSFVYLALQESLDRQVAIKITAPEILRDEVSKQRFEQEARTIAKLEHPCIVGIYEVGRSPQGLMYYVMPYLAKGHLGQRDLRNDEARILAVLRSLLSALGYAHTRGIVHRDVKAENVLFDNADRPVLADFGIALPFRSSARITSVGFAVGSAAYMAPEQARGDNVDGRADLYAVGVLAYEMLTGRLPFQGNDALALAVMHAHDPIPPLPVERRHWQPLLSIAMAKSRDQRFRNAEQMLSALDELERKLQGRPSLPLPAAPGGVAAGTTPLPVADPRADTAIAPATPSAPAADAMPEAARTPWRAWPWVAAGALALGLAGGVWWLLPDPTADGRATVALDPILPQPDAPTVADPIGAVVAAIGAAAVEPEGAGAPVAEPPVAGTAGEAAGTLGFQSQALPYDPRLPAARELAAAERQIARLRLSLPPGDNALDSLRAARALAPRDPALARLEDALLAAFAGQFERLAAEGQHEAAGAAWQRLAAYVDSAGLRTRPGWTALVAAREAGVRDALAGAARGRDADLLAAAEADIARFGLDPATFAAPLRAARLALLPAPGARLAGRGPAMRLVVAPTETRSGWAAMETEVTRADYAAFAAATGRAESRCRGGFLDRRSWRSPGFAQGADEPVVCVTAADAEAFAQWHGQRYGHRYRLPDATQWQAMARGAPRDCAGTRLDCDRRPGTVRAGAGQASPLGLRDVGGNVREWLAGGREAGGGGWRTLPGSLPEAVQTVADPRGQDDLGFRLVREVPLDELLAARSRD